MAEQISPPLTRYDIINTGVTLSIDPRTVAISADRALRLASLPSFQAQVFKYARVNAKDAQAYKQATDELNAMVDVMPESVDLDAGERQAATLAVLRRTPAQEGK